ncbi:MAG: hypothetical protein NC320_03060 [Clostridium sp.]|nr:hypothetical protein [Clostridium sp.]
MSKIYVRGSHDYDIPTLDIDIVIYNLKMIRASAVYADDEMYLSEVVDKYGNIIDEKSYQEYLDFIDELKEYLSNLNYEKYKCHKSNKSASMYFSFECSILDKENRSVFKLKCNIRVSDHPQESKKLRGKNSIEMNVTESKDGASRTHSYQFVTTDYDSYESCMDTIEISIEGFEKMIQKTRKRKFTENE